MKYMYEIFDEFEEVTSKKEKMAVIEKNLSHTLTEVLRLAYHPQFEWLVSELPENYKAPDTLPGISISQISAQLRKLYLFQKGHPTAEKLSPQKRNELLLQILESLEFREAEVVIGIFKKDLGVKGLNYKFVKEAFPNLIP